MSKRFEGHNGGCVALRNGDTDESRRSAAAPRSPADSQHTVRGPAGLPRPAGALRRLPAAPSRVEAAREARPRGPALTRGRAERHQRTRQDTVVRQSIAAANGGRVAPKAARGPTEAPGRGAAAAGRRADSHRRTRRTTAGPTSS